MPDRKFEFRDWMNTNKLKVAAVLHRFGITDQTARHWRSKGVPKTRQDFVSRTIAEWSNASNIGPRLQVQASDEQFRAWNLAALENGQIMEDWARDGLDMLAREHFALHSVEINMAKDAHNPEAIMKQASGTKYRGNS